MASTIVGLIGLGNMGGAMAGHLLAAGYRLVAHDLRPEAVQRAVAKGAEPAGSAAEVASLADMIVTSLPTSREVEQVVLGERGLLESMPPGAVLIDTTSSEPESSRRVAERLRERDVWMLDAPVTGGAHGAVDRTLTAMVGGDPTVLERCRPVLLAFCSEVFHMGPAGSGSIMKSLNNLIGNSTFVITCEVLALGIKAGLSLEQMVDLLNHSPAGNYFTRLRFPRYILTGSYNSGMALKLVNKDQDIATGLARSLNVPLPAATACQQYWKYAMAQGAGSLDATTIFPMIRDFVTGGLKEERAE